jgi:hypothetical protein
MNHVETLIRNSADYWRGRMERPSLHEVVLNHGRAMEVQRLTISEARRVAHMVARGFENSRACKPKQCYMNAQTLIGEYHMRTERHALGGSGNVQYCEGYAAEDGGPMLIGHAWITINAKVVDVTLRANGRWALRANGKWTRRTHSYFGVEVPYALLIENQQKTRCYCPVIEGPFKENLFPDVYSTLQERL